MQGDQFSQKLQLIEAHKDLSQLKNAKMVPPLMLAKLSYLEALIEGDKMSESIIQQLPYYQREDFQEMNADARISIFVSIVRCLAGKETVTYFRRERAYLRKDKAFFGWKKCYIDCDTRHLTLFDSGNQGVPFQQLEVSQLWVSRYYKYYKKKTIFAVYHQDIKYVIGFDQETTCKRIHQTITSLVCDNKDWKCTTFDPLQIKKQINNRLGPQSRQVEQAIICEQLEHLSSLHAKIMRMDQSNEGFKLLKNMDHGRLMANDVKGTIKASIIVKNTNQISLLQNYILQEWNSSVQRLTVTAKPRNNSYVAYLRTNKYSFMSYPRQCYLSFTYYQSCECRSQPETEANSYLIIQSISNYSEPPASGYVRMDLQQIVELSRDKQNTDELLMTVTTLADFKGYAYAKDNIDMAVHLFGNLAQFIPHSQKQTGKSLFEHVKCPCKRQGKGGKRDQRIVSDFSLNSELNLSIDEDHSVTNSMIVERSPFKRASLKSVDSQMIVMLQALLRGIKNEGILGLLNAKKYESYALRHRFKQKDQVFHIFQDENRDFLLQGNRWALKYDEYAFIDEQALAIQKDIIKMIIKQVGTNLVSGKSIMNMSLPVQIFDKRSLLDLIAESLGFLPHYLTRAANETSLVEQIKLVTCAFMFISTTCASIQKPFNPILGQTYQGQLGDFTVDLEQISHHPPISSVYVRSKDIEFHGNFDVTLDMGLNTAYSKVNNWFHLQIFKTNSQYKIKVPDVELGGLMYGNRTFKLAQKGFVYQKNSQLFTQMSIGKTKKRIYEREKIGHADLAGGIFRVRPQFGEKVMQHTGKKAFDGLKPQDVVQSCCFISGKWYGNIKFDEVSYKSITEGPFPQKCERHKYLLPSDSIFRQDVIFKIWKDNAGSNRQKQRLQNLQREDVKLRQRMNKK